MARPRAWNGVSRAVAARAAIARLRRRWGDRKAIWFSRWVACSTDARLASVLSGPLRSVVLWEIFATIGQRFDGGQAPELEAVVEFRIRRAGSGAGDDRYRLRIADRRCRRVRARHGGRAGATVVLELDAVAFARLVAGDASPARLLLRGRLKPRGDLLLAMRLPRLLRLPSPGAER